MEGLDRGLDYIENKEAPIFRVHGLHDLHLLGSDGLFELYRLKRTKGGVLYMETELFIEMPIYSIPPGVVLTTRKIGMAVAEQAIETVGKAWRLN